MTIPLGILALGALVAGYFGAPYFIGEGYSEFWRTSLFTGPDNHILEEAHHSPAWVVWLPTIMMAGGFVLAYLAYRNIWASAKRAVRITGPLDPENIAKREAADREAGVNE